ncbi:hypothetical protein AC230_20750 [Streptomyces caatingaensis]|uniref:Uncharacterized protein n=2 Tax=Streptomyces caatingaensis TaxID=1678637 RepID=A0A0K9XDX5_9ACTN|nr:hypothetical protein AC230_20750 [Streptomyces caatingaensis]
MGVSAVALMGSSLLVAPAAAEAATQEASVQAGCQTWYDNAGPGGARRFHAKCAGTRLHVKAFIYCSDGSYSEGPWRFEYQKAECPSGVRGGSGWYEKRKVE